MGGELKIVEHFYPEEQWVSYTIKGKNPWGLVFKKFTKLVEHILEISSSKMYMRYLMVDDFETYKGGTTVYYRFYVDFRKPLDKNASFWLKSKLSGFQDLKTQEGQVEFKFQPYVEVKFKYANTLQKALIELYWSMFYGERVTALKEESKALFEKLVFEIKSMWGTSTIEERIESAWKEGF